VIAVGKSSPVTSRSRNYPGGTDTLSSLGATRCPLSGSVSALSSTAAATHDVRICYSPRIFASLFLDLTARGRRGAKTADIGENGTIALAICRTERGITLASKV